MHLDRAALNSATVALSNAARETLRMADLVERMMHDTLEVICRDDRARALGVTQNSRYVDALGAAIRRYLADVGDEQTLDHQIEGARGQDILAAVINLEHVADILSNSLVEYSVRSLKQGKALAVAEQELVATMHAALIESLHLALAIFLQTDLRDAERLMARKAQFREFEAAATGLSVQLLRSAALAQRQADPEGERVAEESGLFLRTVRDLRRVHSHLASFAYPVLRRPVAEDRDDSLARATATPLTDER